MPRQLLDIPQFSFTGEDLENATRPNPAYNRSGMLRRAIRLLEQYEGFSGVIFPGSTQKDSAVIRKGVTRDEDDKYALPEFVAALELLPSTEGFDQVHQEALSRGVKDLVALLQNNREYFEALNADPPEAPSQTD